MTPIVTRKEGSQSDKSVQVSNLPAEGDCLNNYQSEISCHGQGPQTHLNKMLIMKFHKNKCDGDVMQLKLSEPNWLC